MQISDERIATMLARPYGLSEAQVSATAAFRRAAGMPWAPATAISRAWENSRRRSVAARTDAERLRVALETEGEMNAIADAHAALSEPERQAIWTRDRNNQAIAAAEHDRRSNLAASAARVAREPGFSVAGFLGQLAQRGAVVSAERGKIIVRGAELDSAGRSLIREHRDAILTALTSPGEAF